jgi:hypothetical protein
MAEFAKLKQEREKGGGVVTKPNIIHFTASSINAGMACPKLYKFKYKDRYRSSQVSGPMNIGILVHKGLEYFWRGQSLENALQAMDREALTDWWIADPGRIAFRKAKAYVWGYYQKWDQPGGDEYKDFDIYIEQEFQFTLDGVTWAGKFDALLHDKQNNNVTVLEHKTTATAIDDETSVYFQKLPMDIQCTIYREAALRMCTGDAIDHMGRRVKLFGGQDDYSYKLPTVTYDVINTTKSSPKQKKKIAKRKVETDEEYAKRKEENQESMIEFYLRVVNAYETNPDKYVRYDIPCTYDQHKIRLQELTRYANLLKDRDKQGFLEIRNSTSCSNYGGCDFLDVCLGRETLAGHPKLMKLDGDHPELDGVGNFKISY